MDRRDCKLCGAAVFAQITMVPDVPMLHHATICRHGDQLSLGTPERYGLLFAANPDRSAFGPVTALFSYGLGVRKKNAGIARRRANDANRLLNGG